MIPSFLFIIIVITLAWGYDFFNGANDCANSIATTVSTRALTPLRAIFLASSLNLVGAFITTKVAATVGKGIIASSMISQGVIISALLGAIIWAASSTYLGIPISVTHALIGGLLGAGLVKGGAAIIHWIVINKIVLAMFLAPLFGFLLGALIIVGLFWLFRKISPSRVNNIFRKGQIISSSFMALTHGMNDTQNAMGIITIALLTQGFISHFKVPWWVIVGSGLWMALGTYFGGWKVMKTLGMKLANIKPVQGFAAELSSTIIIAANTLIGIPISTTQVISTSLMGGASIHRRRAVKWQIARQIVLTWIFTIPGAALLSATIYYVLKLVFHLI